MRIIRIFFGLLLLLASPVSCQAQTSAAPGNAVLWHQYEGTLGTSPIGMTILRDGNQIQGGHYFYRKYLRDIPLTGSMEDSTVTLRESGGGVFHLHFIGNGSNGSAPLDFENSIGMEGTWASADARHTFPVFLRGMGISYGYQGRRYGLVTDQPDAVFERRVQSLVQAVLTGDRTTAVQFISYPLSVHLPNRQTKRCRTPAQVLAAWDEIFTPALVALLRKDLPHDMFVHEGMAMLGDGEAWFDAKGLASINVPSPASAGTTQ